MATTGETQPAVRRSFLSKATAAVASRPNIALAVIVVLTIIVIATLVYYRGLLFLGPYYKPTIGSGVGGSDPSPQALAAGQGAPPAAGDAETERLIDSINGAT